MTTLQELFAIALIGGGATLMMDLWVMLLKRLGVQTLNFAFVGRWVGHFAHCRFAHGAIRDARPISHELALGWITHYAIGVAFASLLVSLAGYDWLRQPSLAPALCVGIGTVVAPLFVMQPALGLGFASSKSATPVRNCLRSVVNHAVFGLGLYLSAALIARLA